MALLQEPFSHGSKSAFNNLQRAHLMMLTDVCDNIREFMRRGILVKTVINGLTFDGATKDPMQKAVRDALIAFMAAMAEAQAEATREAQRAGIAHARANEPLSYRGRKPTFDRARLDL